MADYEKEKAKIKKKNKPMDLLGAGPSPLRILARHMGNKDRKKKMKKELDALPMKVDDFQENHERNKIKSDTEEFAKKVRKKVGIKEPKTKGMKFETVKQKAGGGVVKMRGGGAATKGMNFNRGY